MISTRNPQSLPDKIDLQRICKAISVMDAIISQEWQFRYYSYISNWDAKEECLQMRNGSGDEMHILFLEIGCAINGFCHELEEKDKTKITSSLPHIFDDFIFGEPVKSIETTFCLWTEDLKNWQVGELDNYDDNSENMLHIFDGNPKTYCDWAEDYYELEVSVEIATKIYKGETITREDVLSIAQNVEDWEQLEADLNEIEFPYNFSAAAKVSKWKFW